MAKQRAEATGQLEITLDEQGLEARARFTPGEGETWTPDRLIEAIRARGIVEGFKPDDLRRTFALVLQRGTSEPFVVAKGVSPAEPKPEQARFLEIAVPSQLEEQARRVIGEAVPPRITIEKKERIKKQRTVMRKPKLPFLPPKEESVNYVEEKVHHKRVYVDPTVERTGYAAAGQKIGMVEGKDEGEAGRSVTGDLVATRVLADPYFYCGAGVERRRDELYAEHDGFVRIGANWVDLVPFETHDWELTISHDRATCYFSFDPGHAHAKPPTAADVRAKAEEMGFPTDRLFDDETIEALIARAVSSDEPIENEPLNASRDAAFDIYVPEDKLKAVLNIHKGTGRGAPLNLKELGRAIKQSRLVGLDYEQIKKDIAAFLQSTDTELIGYVLAEGTAPAPGPERTLEFSVRFLPEKNAREIVEHLRQTLSEEGDAVESLSAFPPDAIEKVGEVEADQRVLTVSPEVPGKPGVDVYGQQTPGASAPEPPVKLCENVEWKENIVIATARGLLHRGRRDDTELLRVLPHGDATVSVRVTDNRMAALVTLTPPVGTGRPLDYEDVEAAVRGAGVSSGVRDELLMRAWERASAGDEIRDLIFARGRHVESGGEGKLEMLVETASGKGMTLRADGSADYRNQDRITTVAQGTKIARVRPPADENREGWDVLGTTFQANGTSAVEVDVGENIAVEEEADGARLLVATIDGELTHEGNRFDIRASHSVDGDVDLHTGNVKFPGTITVKGSVRAGFYVMAAGDVQVAELAEAALLSADGDIVVNQGVKGAGKAVLRAKGSIGLTFAEQATILAVGNVQAKNSLVHCKVKSNGKVRMIGDRGSIVGGRIRAREGLVTHNLGSERGVKTQVEFGQDYLIADKIESEEREMEKLKRQVTKIDLAMKEAERSGERGRLDQLHTRKLQMLKALEKRGLRIFTYRERFEEHHESEIVVKGTLYPGVVIETHGRTLEITSPRKNVIVSFSPETGRIEERSAAKESEPQR
ncbi:MAG: flagellar assembly protein A [Spirochaetota bacterium]